MRRRIIGERGRMLYMTIVFEECRGKNGVPTVILACAPGVPMEDVLKEAVECIRMNAHERHPGLGDELKSQDFELVHPSGSAVDDQWVTASSMLVLRSKSYAAL